jgi:hypothetical protein
MDGHSPISPQVLDEDLQIVRSTLASIVDDVSSLSAQAGDAVRDALERIDVAHAEFVSSVKDA